MTYHLVILLFVIFFCKLINCQNIDSYSTNDEKVSVYDKKVEFHGWRGLNKSINEINEIRIGLFLPVDPEDEFNSSLQNAADLAIQEINRNGGYKGLPYKLVNRWSHDPWGAGSKEMIKLIYEDSVWAVIGSQNGENSHIAEQIVTKSFLPLISPLSADPTLNYIGIPWIFRLPPDFRSQAKLIINKGIKESSINRVGLISSSNHDGRTFSNEIKEALKDLNKSLIFHFEVSDQELELSEILERSLEFNPDGLIVHFESSNILSLIFELEKKHYKLPIFLPWIPELDIKVLSEIEYENIMLIDPFDKARNHQWKLFSNKYCQLFGSIPTESAALVYDAIYLLAHSIEKAGLNKTAIRDAIVNNDYINPVTGKMFWDNAGGRIIKPVLINKRIH